MSPPRRRKLADTPAPVKPSIESRSSYPAPDTSRGFVENCIFPIPADRMIELRWDLDTEFDGVFPILDQNIKGARIKPVIYVSEEKSDLVQRDAVREWLLGEGAVYVKAPTLHVIHKKVKRDERHAVDVSIEESLQIFAEETNPRDPKRRIKFAVALARESDSGAVE